MLLSLLLVGLLSCGLLGQSTDLRSVAEIGEEVDRIDQLVAELDRIVNAPSSHEIVKRQDVSKYKNLVLITYKGDFACSGSLISQKLVITSVTCIKKGTAANYKVIFTDHAWRPDKTVAGFTFTVEKLILENRANGLGLMQLHNIVRNAVILPFDVNGKIQPWVKKEIVVLAGWEGRSAEESGEDTDEESDETDESEEEDNSGEYKLSAYNAAVDRACPSAANDTSILCLTPKKNFDCAGFRGGIVISADNALVLAVISADAPTSACAKRMLGTRLSSSMSWLSAHTPPNMRTWGHVTPRPFMTNPPKSAADPTRAAVFRGLLLLLILLLLAQTTSCFALH